MPALTAPLDYPKKALTIGVSSPIEYQFRAHPAGKEPWTVAFIEGMKRGDVLWDIGANVGSYALIAAALGRTVVAVEPGRANFNALLENMQRNRIDGQVIALNVALGATTAVIPFPQHGSPGYGEGGSLMLDVQQITLDELAFGMTAQNPAAVPPAPTHLKIDVDGHELSVLAGAHRTLTEGPCRAVMIEVASKLGERVSDLLALWGWQRVAVHDQRDGQPIAGVRYEEHRRP